MTVCMQPAVGPLRNAGAIDFRPRIHCGPKWHQMPHLPSDRSVFSTVFANAPFSRNQKTSTYRTCTHVMRTERPISRTEARSDAASTPRSVRFTNRCREPAGMTEPKDKNLCEPYQRYRCRDLDIADRSATRRRISPRIGRVELRSADGAQVGTTLTGSAAGTQPTEGRARDRLHATGCWAAARGVGTSGCV